MVGPILLRPSRRVKQTDGARNRRHEFESIGEILSRLRRERRKLEARMRPEFEPALSLLLDDVLQREAIVDEKPQ